MYTFNDHSGSSLVLIGRLNCVINISAIDVSSFNNGIVTSGHVEPFSAEWYYTGFRAHVILM